MRYPFSLLAIAGKKDLGRRTKIIKLPNSCKRLLKFANVEKKFGDRRVTKTAL